MKTALDTLMDALESDTWTPPIAPTTIREEVQRGVRPSAEQPPKDHTVANSIAPCGSSQCAGCYEVAPGVRIHPPKCGEEYREWNRKWLERWEAKGRLQ